MNNLNLNSWKAWVSCKWGNVDATLPSASCFSFLFFCLTPNKYNKNFLWKVFHFSKLRCDTNEVWKSKKAELLKLHLISIFILCRWRAERLVFYRDTTATVIWPLYLETKHLKNNKSNHKLWGPLRCFLRSCFVKVSCRCKENFHVICMHQGTLWSDEFVWWFEKWRA